MGNRTCSVCGIEKPPEMFNSRDGRPLRLCRDCGKAQSRAWREKNQDRYRSYAAEYRAEYSKEISERAKAWRRANPEAAKAQDARENAGRYEKNKEVVTKRIAAWKKANPEKVNAINSARRARLKGTQGHFTVQDIKELLDSQKGRCAHLWCKKSIHDGYHVDHIMPAKLGGSGDKSNIQLLCQPCNLRKAAQHPVVYAQKNGMLL